MRVTVFPIAVLGGWPGRGEIRARVAGRHVARVTRRACRARGKREERGSFARFDDIAKLGEDSMSVTERVGRGGERRRSVRFDPRRALHAPSAGGELLTE